VIAAIKKLTWTDYMEFGFFIVLALTPLLWFGNGALITGGDTDFPLDPLRRMYERIFAWNPNFLSGADHSLDIATLFFSAVEALPYLITHNLVTSEKLSFIFWFGMSGAAMWFLAGVLFPGKRLFRILATTFYMFNFFQFSNWEEARIGQLSATVMLPVVLAGYVSYVRGKITIAQYICVCAIGSIIGMGLGVQPPEIVVFLIFYGIYTVLELAVRRFFVLRSFIRRVVALATPFIVFIGVNMVWILPEANFIRSSSYTDANTVKAVFDLNALLSWGSEYSSFLNNFILAGHTAFYDSWQGTSYLPIIQHLLLSNIWYAFELLIPLTAFAALLVGRGRVVAYVAVGAILSIFLSKGIHPPFGLFYTSLARSIPGMWTIRAPWDKFGLLTMFSYSVLIGITGSFAITFLAERIEKQLHGRIKQNILKAGALAICSIGIITLCYPLLLGGGFPYPHGGLPGKHVTIPKYVSDAAKWVNQQNGQFRIVPMPDTQASIYRWGYASPLDVTLREFTKPVLNREYGQGEAPPHPIFILYDRLAGAIYKKEYNEASALGGLLGVRYYLQRNDIVYNFYSSNGDDPNAMARRLSRIPGVHLTRRFGAWDFYENDNAIRHTYAASSVMVDRVGMRKTDFAMANGSKNAVYFFSPLNRRDRRSLQPVIGNEQQYKNRDTTYLSIVNRIPTSEQIDIYALHPYVLVFGDNYSPGWHLYAGRPGAFDILFGRVKPLSDTLLVNGYANGWVVRDTNIKKLTIFYEPQVLVVAGALVSLMCLVFVGLFLCVDSMMNRVSSKCL